jgi:hypothetical protein
MRMAGLVRQEERAAARELALRAAGVDLVAAAGREQVNRAAISAAQTLVDEGVTALSVCTHTMMSSIVSTVRSAVLKGVFSGTRSMPKRISVIFMELSFTNTLDAVDAIDP